MTTAVKPEEVCLFPSAAAWDAHMRQRFAHTLPEGAGWATISEEEFVNLRNQANCPPLGGGTKALTLGAPNGAPNYLMWGLVVAAVGALGYGAYRAFGGKR